MSYLYKLLSVVFLFFHCFILAQNGVQKPSNTFFYMEVNGKQLDKKINWEKINPFLHEMEKNDKKKMNWNDYAKTGIDYTATQYHHAVRNDSVTSYTVHFTINNLSRFLEFINSSKKEGQVIGQKNNYSYIDINNKTFVAWNNQKAVLRHIYYKKLLKAEVLDMDSAAVVTDSVAVAVDSAAAKGYNDELPNEEMAEKKPFNYKEEIKYLKEEIDYFKNNIKESQKEIAELRKTIKHLEKYHKYPKGKDPYQEEENPETDENSTESEEAEPPVEEEDSDLQKELEAEKIENFKIVRSLSEKYFDQYFSNEYKTDIDARMLSGKDANADVFIYSNFQNLFKNEMYGKLSGLYKIQNLFARAYNSDSFYNIYFDQDKVRLIHDYQHRDAEMQKNLAKLYKGKRNRKLASLVNDQSIGFMSININSRQYFDALYDMFKGDDENQEIGLFIETMKIVLDEKAISELAPGNGIFILNDFKKKKVTYTDYEYDEEHNEKEVQKTKEVSLPDFTFAFATKNESYWVRVFDAMLRHKYFGKNLTKYGNIYSFKDEKSKSVDKMFFTVKDEIVYFTTSIENLNKEKSSCIVKNAKESTKHALYGEMDFQKIFLQFEEEVKDSKDKKSFDYVKKNIGTMIYKTSVKDESIQTEMIYKLRNSESENSLMYFFDMFKEIYKEEMKKEEKFQ